MNEIFDLTYRFLKWTSELTGFSYREINIIIYFIVIPSFLIFLLSIIYKNKFLIISFLGLVLISIAIIPDFTIFSNQLFDYSVIFLNWFDRFGLNYIQASVVICVIIPILLIILLLFVTKKTSKTRL